MIQEGFFNNVGASHIKELGECVVHNFETHNSYGVSSYVPSPKFELSNKYELVISSKIYTNIEYRVDLTDYLIALDRLLTEHPEIDVKKELDWRCKYIIVKNKDNLHISTHIQDRISGPLKELWPAKVDAFLRMIESPIYLCQNLETYIHNNLKDISMGRANMKELKDRLKEVLDKL